MSHIQEIYIADVIIEAMPFHENLSQWCRTRGNVKQALKFSNSDNFLPIGAIQTSHPKVRSEDEVIGFIVYDPSKKIFKQDYIVNIGTIYKQFVLYTKVPGKQYDKEVKHIKQFYAVYDRDGGYEMDHHLTLEQLEHKALVELKPLLAEMAREVVDWGNQGWEAHPSQRRLREVLDKVLEDKKKRTQNLY